MKVIKNEKIAPDVFILTIQDKEIATTAKPGQFVTIRVSNSYSPLLRRPFSVYYVEGETFKILYKVIGKGTKKLSTYKANEKLDIIGPLGNCFIPGEYQNFLFIAGGIGVAPIHFLVNQIVGANSCLRLTTLIGAKTKTEVLCEPEFSNFGKVMVSTEDGSYGTKGMVTDLFETIEKPEIIFACGPLGMLKAIKSYARSHFIPCQFSLEQHMACGIGVCLGCAIPVKNGYKYVCKDGPVFWADEIEI